jgi:hypothetical protein
LAFVRLSRLDIDRFEQSLRGEPAVVAVWHIVGDIDLAAQVCCPGLGRP